MRTKFIGLDGFNEIETITSKERLRKRSNKSFDKLVRISRELLAEQKKERAEKKAKRKSATRLEKAYSTQRRRGSGNLSASAIAASKSIRRSIKPTRILKSKVALGLATSFVAAILCLSVANGTLSINASATDVKAVKAEKSGNGIRINDNQVSKTVHTELSKSLSDDEILTDGYGLYIDNQLVGVSLDKEALEKELTKLLDDYKAKYDEATTDKFENDVDIVYGAYKSVYVDDSDRIVAKNKDKFSFSLSTDIEYTANVDYDVIVRYDKTKYTSYSKVIQKGREGKVKYTYRATFIDGVHSDSELTKTETLRKVRNKIVVKGTKKKVVRSASSSYTSYEGSGSSNGGFIWPLPYTHNITSGYGSRWGSFHSGIDIAGGGTYGQTIIASDGGTVEWAGYDNSGYGNYVIINHNNGYKTLYGHCSRVFVSSGQRVSQGQSIAAVGSTGNSTGPHLHFEVRTSGGARLNPLGFVG